MTVSRNQNKAMMKSFNLKKGPTLEAVLNDFSRKRMKLPTIQSKVKKSVGQLMESLPEQDKYIGILNFNGNLKLKGNFLLKLSFIAPK